MAEFINSGESSIINGGADNDNIRSYGGTKFTISGNDGDDFIINGSYSTISNGAEVTVISGGTSSLIDGGADNDFIFNYAAYTSIGGGFGSDSIVNYAANASVEGGEGDDTINNANTNYTDYDITYKTRTETTYEDVYDWIQEPYTYYAFEPVKKYMGNGLYVTAYAQKTETRYRSAYKKIGTKPVIETYTDEIKTPVEKQTSNSGSTLSGGAGNDLIINSGTLNVTFQYKEGDGFDTIEGFDVTSALQIGDGTATYSAQISGDNILVEIGGGSIMISGAASLPSVNIIGSEIPIWKFGGTSATYGTFNNALVNVSGVSSLDGLAIDDKIVTVANSALNQGTVTISDGYELVLGEDVTRAEKIIGGWSLFDTVATYTHAATIAGYSLADNQISYLEASGGETFTVSGVKDTLGLSLSGITVTVADSALNFLTLTISDGYELALGDDVKVSTTKTGWSKLENGNMAYQTDFTTAGYSLANNQINYVTAIEGEILAELNGVADNSTPTLDGSNITLAADNFANNLSVVDSKIYDFELTTNNYSGKSFTATDKADKITNAGSNVIIDGNAGNDKISNSGTGATLRGGAGNDTVTISSADGGNTYVYSAGDGKDIIFNFKAGDKIQILGTTDIAEEIKSNDAVIKVGKGTITVKDAATSNMKIALINTEGETISENKYTTNGVISDGTIKLSETLKQPYTQEDNINVVDGSQVKGGAQITGNNKGGTLLGGAGNDTFTFGGGNVTIVDYGAGGADKINLGSFDEIGYNIINSDVVLNLGNNNTLTIQNGKGKDITFADRKLVVKSYTDEGIFENKNKSLILSADTEGSFSAAKLSKLVTINGSRVGDEIAITGNKKANLIIAGNNGSTLNGGKGKDTLVGGAGDDVFIYENKSGNKVIQKCDENDIINLGEKASISQVTTKKGNAIFKVGSNTITVEDIETFNIAENGEIKTYDDGNLVSGDSVTLGSGFKGTFNLDDNDEYNHVNAELGKKAVNLIGDAGNNSLIGGKGKDSLNGGESSDTLNGGKGNDTLWGGDGADTFVYQAGEGTDIICDYNFGDGDLLQILDKKGDVISKGAIKKATFKGEDLTLAIKGGGKLILAGVGTSATVNVNGNRQAF